MNSNRWECVTLDPSSAESAVEDRGGAFSCDAVLLPGQPLLSRK